MTVGGVLARYRMPLLAHLDLATGQPVREPKPIRYEKQVPGELIHVDIKKLGIIPDGGGRGSAQDRRACVTRDGAARRGASPSRGHAFLHHAVDDCTRLAPSERLPDERKEIAAAFWGNGKISRPDLTEAWGLVTSA